MDGQKEARKRELVECRRAGGERRKNMNI